MKNEKVAEFEGVIDQENFLFIHRDIIRFDDTSGSSFIVFPRNDLLTRFPLKTKVKIIIETIGDSK